MAGLSDQERRFLELLRARSGLWSAYKNFRWPMWADLPAFCRQWFGYRSPGVAAAVTRRSRSAGRLDVVRHAARIIVDKMLGRCSHIGHSGILILRTISGPRPQQSKDAALDPDNPAIKTQVGISQIDAGQGEQGRANVGTVFGTEAGAPIAGPTLCDRTAGRAIRQGAEIAPR